MSESFEQDRKLDEVEFHNRRELDRQSMPEQEFLRKYANKKYYSIVRSSHDYIAGWVAANCAGKVVLDYCCGLGGVSLDLAKAGATVYGIDISSESVETARRLLAENGLADRAHFEVMDAEHTTFPDAKFDAIICSGVLHHLDLSSAYAELARLLKPGGAVLCVEALGHNPAIALYRRLTPKLRTGWEAEHILKMSDVRKAEALFGKVESRFFHLASIAAVPFRRAPFFAPLLRTLETFDRVLLRIPGVRLMAWQVIFELRQPRRRAPHASLAS